MWGCLWEVNTKWMSRVDAQLSSKIGSETSLIPRPSHRFLFYYFFAAVEKKIGPQLQRELWVGVLGGPGYEAAWLDIRF